MATRFTTTAVREKVYEYDRPEKIRIAELTMGYRGPEYYYMYVIQEPEILDQLKTAVQRRGEKDYPSIFSSDPDAFPVSVDLVVTKEKNDALLAIGVEIITIGIMGGILPLPFNMYRTYEVNTGFYSPEGDLLFSSQSEFIASMNSWITVLTPLGLIYPPGPSHAEKVNLFSGGMNPEESFNNQLLARSIAQCVAHELTYNHQ